MSLSNSPDLAFGMGLWSTAAALTLAYIAQAQVPYALADQLDRRQSEDSELELVPTLPVLFSSSVVDEIDESVISDSGDWHVDPDLAFEWSREFPLVKLSGVIGATLERYARASRVDADTLIASVKAEFTDGRSDLFVPYVSHESSLEFLPTFSRHEETLHDIAIGFSSAVAWGSNRTGIPRIDRIGPGESSLEFDVQAGRRFASPKEEDRVFIEASIEFTRTISQTWAVGIKPGITARWYDDYFGAFRRDYRPSVELNAEWKPAWLAMHLPGAEIEFIIEIERNFSTVPEQRYSIWEAGPIITIAHEF